LYSKTTGLEVNQCTQFPYSEGSWRWDWEFKTWWELENDNWVHSLWWK